MSNYDDQIDALYDEMEQIEDDIAAKQEIIEDLENRLAELLN
jgi:predicted  nucleic acid-binding Zn-ribbon protein